MRNFPILAHNSVFHKLGNTCALAIETLCKLLVVLRSVTTVRDRVAEEHDSGV